MKLIDMRSDTVTLPSPAMRQAMYDAEVGDADRGDDPTVDRLEALAAKMVGKEASLFVPSGTMGNLLAHMTHCNRGDEAIVGHLSHTLVAETGSASGIAGVQLRQVHNDNARMDPDEIEGVVNVTPGVFQPKTGLIWVENTHVISGGTLMPLDNMAAIRDVATRHGLPVHLDGARIFNAALALGCKASEIASHADSLMFCLSKGLSAPVGSMLCGTRKFIAHAYRNRKMLGGSMRQSGVLAAAGIVALEQMIDRLQDDHDNARALAEGFKAMDGMDVDLDIVQSNIVHPLVTAPKVSPRQIVEELGVRNIRTLAGGGRRLRFVTHYGIEREDIDTILGACREIIAAAG